MIQVIKTDDSKWDNFLENMPLKMQDIYFTSDYHKLYELNGDGEGRVFIYSEGNKLALYPFMTNEIVGYQLDKKYYDIETVYGYGGPIVNSDDEEFIEKFENNFLQFCINNDIVAEFIRFHPLIKNENIFKRNIEVLQNRITVSLDTFKNEERIWKEDISSKNRNVIRKAIKNGLVVEESRDFEMFKNIYKITMDKVNANNYYYFGDDYYNIMKKDNNYHLLNVKKDGITISSAIFMQYKNYFHYHLAGSLKEYLTFSPNNLLLWEAIKMAHANNCILMHLGGGIENNKDDTLFKFKSSFSKCTSNFYIGKRIHNKKIYDYLINTWERKNNREAKMLLQYRY